MVFRALVREKLSEITEGHLIAEHVHILLSPSPRYALVQIVGHVKGKSAIDIALVCTGEDGAPSDNMSGRGDIACRWSDTMKPMCVAECKSRKKKTSTSRNYR